MPVLKEKKREQIVEAAKHLFKEKGFRETTIRDIAYDAGLKHSNIRNYFKKKDEIFDAIVRSTYESIKDMQKFQKDRNFVSSEQIMDFSISNRTEYIAIYVDFVHTHRDELFLLFFRAEGSSYENACEELATSQENINAMLFTNATTTLQRGAKTISPFIFHNLAHFFLMITGEMVKHDIPKEKIREYANDFYIICISGIQGLLRPDK